MSGLRRRHLLAALAALATSSAVRPARAAAPQPRPLRRGSRVVAIAPGTWWENPGQEAEALRERFAAEGWELRIPPAAMGRWHWFSASDRDRLEQWRRASGDPDTDAVVAVAGGWGSARLLETGWRPAARPQWLVGFSDASALLLAQLASGRGGAIHAGLRGDPSTWSRLVKLLRREAVEPLQGLGWRGGSASGPLVVSNLTVATHLIGTTWLPDLSGCVVIFEDVGEAPYRVDRMLTQWRTAGLLEGVAAVGLGHFSWKRDDILPGDFSMEQVLRERLGDLGVPLVGRLPVGHGRPNLALPLGVQARLDGDRGTLELV